MADLTDAELDELEQLQAWATPAPWQIPLLSSPNDRLKIAARNALPALIAEIRRLRTLVADMEQAKEDAAYNYRTRDR